MKTKIEMIRELNRGMEKYSIEWKKAQQAKKGGWPQYHAETKSWKWHYIKNDTEYRKGDFLTRKECEAVNAIAKAEGRE